MRNAIQEDAELGLDIKNAGYSIKVVRMTILYLLFSEIFRLYGMI